MADCSILFPCWTNNIFTWKKWLLPAERVHFTQRTKTDVWLKDSKFSSLKLTEPPSFFLFDVIFRLWHPKLSFSTTSAVILDASFQKPVSGSECKYQSAAMFFLALSVQESAITPGWNSGRHHGLLSVPRLGAGRGDLLCSPGHGLEPPAEPLVHVLYIRPPHSHHRPVRSWFGEDGTPED